MKLRHLLLCIAALWAFTGCDRVIKIYEPAPLNSSPLGQDFSKPIQDIVSPTIIETLKKNGQTINDGQKPPNIEGIYVYSKQVIIGSNLKEDQDSLHLKIYSDYKYRFYEQTNNNGTIKVDEKSLEGSSSATGKNGFVSGNGNLFTVFIESLGTSNINKNGKTYTVTLRRLNTYSGEITPVGIKNLVTSFYLKSKSADPENAIVDVGTVRVFKDKDGFSEKTNTFRLAAPEYYTGTKSVAIPHHYSRQ
jgi:hypothetical protein